MNITLLIHWRIVKRCMNTSNAITIEDQDLPALFRVADRISMQQQKDYLRYVFLDLALVVAGAITGSIALDASPVQSAIAFISALLFGAGLLLTVYIRNQQFEQNWYDGRAIAESVKTQAWRFMTAGEPYPESLSERDAELIFVQMLDDLIKERRRFAAYLATDVGNEPPVTPKMHQLRQLSFQKRKQLYLNERINNQRDWYSRKAKANLISSNRWFNTIIVSQAFALVSSLVLVKWPDLPINLTGIFAAITAAFIAWQQLKKHRELANSYGLAAQELASIAAKASYIDSSEAFVGFVTDAENAISREHTMWIARRDQPA
jgi:hypothetical protein